MATDPLADNTDVYAFRSPDKPDTVTLVANFSPTQEPAGGPNFFEFDPTVLYEIHVDANGDATTDKTYQFRFKTKTRNEDTFLYNTNPINTIDDKDWNRPQYYTVSLVEDDGHKGKSYTLGRNLPTPPSNVGPRSTPEYDKLAAQAVHTLSLKKGYSVKTNTKPEAKVFAGQRDDPFFVDTGAIFDLGGLRPFNALHLAPLPAAPGVDGLSGFNVQTIALQIPINELAYGPNKTIGVYASASRKAIRVLGEDGHDAQTGPWVQVSRLGNPLVNEVLIPLGEKDRWNRSEPENDDEFVEHYTDPELAGLVNLLYPQLPDVMTTGRDDLVAVLLTGIPGLNNTGDRKADFLRLNVTTPVTTPSKVKRLGALEGDFQGFPNGRRLADDVTDIELRAVACGYGPILAASLMLCNLTPNNTIGDGVDTNDRPFLSTFPYVAAPQQGYDHAHDHTNG